MSRPGKHRQQTKEAYMRDCAITQPGQRNHATWTKWEYAFLRKYYRKLSLTRIALHLNRRYSAVAGKVHLLGLWKRHVKWTKTNDAFLRKHRVKGWLWCAKQLGKTHRQVTGRAQRLGLLVGGQKCWRTPQGEAKRLETFKKNAMDKYGVANPCQIHKILRRKHRRASLVMGVETLGTALADVLSKAERNL